MSEYRATSGGAVSGGEFDLSNPGASFVDTVRRVVTQPTQFFSGIGPQGAGLVPPLVFSVLCTLISAILSAIVSVVGGRSVGVVLTNVIVALLGAVIGLFVGAAILHLFVLLVIRPNEGYVGTFRVLGYSSVTSLISWIPIIGPIIALAGYVVLNTIGYREVHRTTTGKVALAVLIPVVIGVVLAFLLFAAILALIVGARAS